MKLDQEDHDASKALLGYELSNWRLESTLKNTKIVVSLMQWNNAWFEWTNQIRDFVFHGQSSLIYKCIKFNGCFWIILSFSIVHWNFLIIKKIDRENLVWIGLPSFENSCRMDNYFKSPPSHCMQSHETVYKLMKLYASWIQAHGTACKVIELHAKSWNCM